MIRTLLLACKLLFSSNLPRVQIPQSHARAKLEGRTSSAIDKPKGCVVSHASLRPRTIGPLMRRRDEAATKRDAFFLHYAYKQLFTQNVKRTDVILTLVHATMRLLLTYSATRKHD